MWPARSRGCVASRAAFAPPSTAAVEIGLEQSRALRIGCAYLLKQQKEILIPQRGQGSSGESPLETPSVHVAAVVVEHHLQSIGAHAGFLACRFSWCAEKALEARQRRHAQAEMVAVEDEHEGRKGDKDWQWRHPQNWRQSRSLANRALQSG